MGRLRAATRPICKHGHPWPEHLAFNNRGHATCAECTRISHRRHYVPIEPDEAAIQRAVAGDPPPRLSPRERAAAVLTLTARNVAAWRIAEQIGCSQRTVHRVRSRYAAAA